MTSPTKDTEGLPHASTRGRRGVLLAAFACAFALAAFAPRLAYEGRASSAKSEARIVASSCLVNICNKKHASIRLKAEGTSRSRPTCYRWQVDGGRIEGEGAEVTWDFADTRPGTGKFYVARLTVGGGESCGGQPVPATPKRVLVWDCPSSSSTPVPTPTPIRRPTPTPEPTITPTVTPTPTYEPTPEPTIEPTATPTPTTRRLTLNVSVVNARDGRPLKGARVSLRLGASLLADAEATDDRGRFTRTSLAPGTYLVEVSADDFELGTRTVRLGYDSDGPVLFSLKPRDKDTVQVVEYKPSPEPTPSPHPSPTPDASPTIIGAATPQPSTTNANVGPNESPQGNTNGSSDGGSKFAGWSLWVLPGALVLAALGFAAYMLLNATGAASAATAGAALQDMAGEAAAAAAATTKQTDKVYCTVFGPRSARPGDDLLIQAFAHLLEQAAQLEALAKAPDPSAERLNSKLLGREVAHGKELFFRFDAGGLEAKDPELMLMWDGDPASVEFIVPVPADAQPRRVAARVIFGVVGDDGSRVPSGHVSFMFDLAAAATPQPAATAVAATAAPPPAQTEPLEQTLVHHECAFISYARPNRLEVQKRVQAFRAAGLKCIMDAVSFEAGDEWAPAIRRYIDESDVFYLFWSTDASKSEWVNREIDFAVELSEDDDKPLILPVPLEDPSVVQPPEKLKHLHFDDPMLAHMDAEELRQLRKRMKDGG